MSNRRQRTSSQSRSWYCSAVPDRAPRTRYKIDDDDDDDDDADDNNDDDDDD